VTFRYGALVVGPKDGVVLGFGEGEAALGTEMEGYLMTKQGLHRLGGAEVEAGTGKASGAAASS